MDYSQSIDKAKKIIETEIEYDNVFELKSLFPLHEWENLKKGHRVTLGRLFSAEVDEGKVNQVIKKASGKSNHNHYIKIKK